MESCGLEFLHEALPPPSSTLGGLDSLLDTPQFKRWIGETLGTCLVGDNSPRFL